MAKRGSEGTSVGFLQLTKVLAAHFTPFQVASWRAFSLPLSSPLFARYSFERFPYSAYLPHYLNAWLQVKLAGAGLNY